MSLNFSLAIKSFWRNTCPEYQRLLLLAWKRSNNRYEKLFLKTLTNSWSIPTTHEISQHLFRTDWKLWYYYIEILRWNDIFNFNLWSVSNTHHDHLNQAQGLLTFFEIFLISFFLKLYWYCRGPRMSIKFHLCDWFGGVVSQFASWTIKCLNYVFTFQYYYWPLVPRRFIEVGSYRI